ncbi:YtzI protein [Peribacillus tepidiphilus]
MSVMTTSKAYGYKHTVDTLENNPYLEDLEKNKKEEENIMKG